MEMKVDSEELEDLEMKAMEMNLASTAMLDLIKVLKLKNKMKDKKVKVPDFWNDLEEKKEIRINRN